MSSDLRDRLNAQARAAGVTVAQLVERLLADAERDEHFRVLRENFAAMSAQDRAEYMTEVDAWDSTVSDGLTEPW